MCDDLSKYGMIEEKTWKTFLPTIDDNLMPHLIRGLIDGDGWITLYKPQTRKYGCGLGFCGNKDLVLGVRDYLCNKLNVYPVKHTLRNKLHQILWCSAKDVAKISNYIYENSNIYLTRKYDTANKIKQLVQI